MVPDSWPALEVADQLCGSRPVGLAVVGYMPEPVDAGDRSICYVSEELSAHPARLLN